MKNYTDEQLIKLAVKKDKNALETLVARYLKAVYGFTYQYARNREDAEDITQEIFIKVWKNLNKFKDNKKFRPWLYEIAKNTSLDFLKKKNPIPFSYLDSAAGDNSEKLDNIIKNTVAAPVVMIEQSFLINKLSLAIKILSPKYAEIISLYHKQELNFREIAEINGESINTVKSRYRRALLLVKKLYPKPELKYSQKKYLTKRCTKMHLFFVLLYIDKYFKKFIINKDIEVPPDLFDKVMLGIERKKNSQALRRRFVLALISFLPFLFITFPVWRNFQINIIQSGFSEYLALLFYDFKIVLANWQDFGLSLLESLPVISMAATLAVLLGLSLTLKFVIRYGRELFKPSILLNN